MSADVTHFGLIRGELAGGDHFVKFQACGNACKISSFINRSESVVEVCRSIVRGVGVKAERGLRSGCMTESGVGIFLGCSKHICFVTEGIGENGFVTCVGKLSRFLVTIIAFFGDIGYDSVLFFRKTFCFASGFERVDKVLVVRRSIAVQRNESGNFFIALARRREADRSECHRCDKQQS